MRFTRDEVALLVMMRIDAFWDDRRDLATAANDLVLDCRRLEKLA